MSIDKLNYYKFHYEIENDDRKFNRTSAFQYYTFFAAELGGLWYLVKSDVFEYGINIIYNFFRFFPLLSFIEIVAILLFLSPFYLIMRIVFLFYAFSNNQLNPNNNPSDILELSDCSDNIGKIIDVYKYKSEQLNKINIENAFILREIRNYELDMLMVIIMLFVADLNI